MQRKFLSLLTGGAQHLTRDMKIEDIRRRNPSSVSAALRSPKPDILAKLWNQPIGPHLRSSTVALPETFGPKAVPAAVGRVVGAVIHKQESRQKVPKSVLRAVVGRMQPTLRATRRTPHGSSCLLGASNVCLVGKNPTCSVPA